MHDVKAANYRDDRLASAAPPVIMEKAYHFAESELLAEFEKEAIQEGLAFV